MNSRHLSVYLGIGITVLLNQSSFAQLYSEDFNTDHTANWTVNDSGITDTRVDFFYDYSAIGVPAAPSGIGTLGLVMSANNSSNVFGGVSVSPTGQSFTGDYQVSFDLWQNYVGPVGPGGSGTTQLSTFGIGTTGANSAWPGSADTSSGANGVYFDVTLDGGSSVDYRVYSSAAPTGYPEGDGVFSSGGGRNGSDPYYAVFGGDSAPGDQVTLYPGQTGTTDAGEIGFAWRRVTIDVAGGFATWSVDGTPLASVDLSTVVLGGDNILFGHSDSNGSSSSDPNASLLNVTLIDNIVVQVIPEPSSLALCGLGALALLARRRC